MKKWHLIVIIILGVLLIVSVAINAKQYVKIQKLDDYAVEEYSYAEKITNKTYSIIPEEGMAFVDGDKELEEVLFSVKDAYAGCNLITGLYRQNFYRTGLKSICTVKVDLNLLQPKRDSDIGPAHKIVQCFLMQMAEQGEWLGGGHSNIAQIPQKAAGDFGILSGQAGAITIIAIPDRYTEGLFYVGYTADFRSGVIRAAGFSGTSGAGYLQMHCDLSLDK